MVINEIASVGILLDALHQVISLLASNASPLAVQMEPIGNSALPQWSVSFDQGENIYMTVVMRFIQLVGFVAILKGSTGTMRYFSPEQHPKKPPNLFAPLTQLFLGMLCLVPEAVIDMAMDLVNRVNW